MITIVTTGDNIVGTSRLKPSKIITRGSQKMEYMALHTILPFMIFCFPFITFLQR